MTRRADMNNVRRTYAKLKSRTNGENSESVQQTLRKMASGVTPDFESCKPKLLPWIETIVTSLNATHHNFETSGASKEFTQSESKNFLEYLLQNPDWPSLAKHLTLESTHSSRSSLRLSREYSRFIQYKNSRIVNIYKFHPPSQKSDAADSIVETLLEVTSELVSDIECFDQKLCFQLFLEGLLDSEISTLLKIELVEVQLFIEKSRIELKSDVEESDFGV